MWMRYEWTVGFNYPEDFIKEQEFIKQYDGWMKHSQDTTGSTYTWAQSYIVADEREGE